MKTRDNKMQMQGFNEMKQITVDFYKTIGIDDIPEKYLHLAVMSLTMPEYSKEYKDHFKDEIGNHSALATVGDSVCEAFLMLNSYPCDSYNITAEKMSGKKSSLTNVNLNKIGEELLKDHLFYRNNDLKDGNIKSYATAFEAVIGFIALLDMYTNKNRIVEFLKEYIN